MFDLGFFVFMDECEKEAEKEDIASRSTETNADTEGSEPHQKEKDD